MFSIFGVRMAQRNAVGNPHMKGCHQIRVATSLSQVSRDHTPFMRVQLVSEPDPRKIEKEGLAHRLGWKCTLRPV